MVVTVNDYRENNTLSKTPKSNCNLYKYIGFLLGEPSSANCSKMGETLKISHDSVTRFLYRENFTGKDLFDEAAKTLNLKGGILSVDDTVLDKPYSRYISFVGHFWSGKHHKTVKGINLITLYYTDSKGNSLPINFRIYDKEENKTKNDYFIEMLEEVLRWGLKPSFTTSDSWYSCVKNLKTIKKHQLGFFVGLESNRLVSIIKGTFVNIKELDIPDNGLVVWLKDFGHVKVFRTNLKDQIRHYAIYLPEGNDNEDNCSKMTDFSRFYFETLHNVHWNIEQYHRTIKQVCNVEKFQVRGKVAVQNHIFASILGYVQLKCMSAMDIIDNCYSLHKALFQEVICKFVNFFVEFKQTEAQFTNIVNA